MARKSFLAVLVGVAAFAVPSASADKGGNPHDGSSGLGRPADQQTSAAAQGKAKANGHAKLHAKAQAKAKGHAKAQTNVKAHVKAQGKANGHAKIQVTGQAKVTSGAQGPPATNTHAKAGKTTICHATGSSTNPYVRITISNNALAAHRRHQGGRDIIPAPLTACPAATASQVQPGTTQPAVAAPQSTSTSPTANGQVLGKSTSGKSPNKVSVLGASTSGTSPSASSAPAATTTRAASSSRLPFTGTDAIIVAILGLAAVLLGVTVRRATRASSGRI